MGKLLGSYIFPHPPIVLPEIGDGKEREALKTITAMEECAEQIKKLNPDTIIITTPHGPIFSDYIFMSESATLRGDFSNFGHSELEYSFENNLSLVSAIKAAAYKMGILCGDISEKQYKEFRIPKGLDHGALVPLYYIAKKLINFNIVHISVADFSNLELYSFGIAIKQAIENIEGTFVFVGSGDLSHKFSEESPYGFSPKGPEFDKLLMEAMAKSDVEAILTLDPKLSQDAAECGLKSFIIMLGANDQTDLSMKVLSHEGPFGIGYGVVELLSGDFNKKRDFLNIMKTRNEKNVIERKNESDLYVQLAQMSLEYYLINRKPIALKEVIGKLNLPDEMLKNKSGVFVSIKKNGQLRGCIGTIGPVTNSIAEEIIANSISAGVKDPRFNPVAHSELEELVFSVDVLFPSETIPDSSMLDVKKYGVIVESGYKRGLLLPNLEGVDSIAQQIDIALSKAGISKDEKYEMERFEVIRHE